RAQTITTLKWMHCLGVNDVVITTESTLSADGLHFSNTTELLYPEETLGYVIAEARKLGLSVTLSPQLRLAGRAGTLADHAFTPQNWSKFFQNYAEHMRLFGEIAEQNGVSRLLIGNRFGGQITGADNRAHWQRLIHKVRGVFSGHLSYTANTSTQQPESITANEAAFVSFWDNLDEVGVAVYPALTRKSSPTLSQLKRAFYRNDDGNNSVAPLRALAKKSGKPVIIFEMGARSIKGKFWDTLGSALINPEISNDDQTTLLQASLYIWLGEMRRSWLDGIVLRDAIAFSRHHGNRRWWDRDFTVQHKPSADVVKTFFAKGKEIDHSEPACTAFAVKP
ncbi:MAG: hypothetical protein HQL50_09200, partial [Magnetococcales bacterium]|nr:hypothetical protein [Magnetococcales bacterium]